MMTAYFCKAVSAALLLVALLGVDGRRHASAGRDTARVELPLARQSPNRVLKMMRFRSKRKLRLPVQNPHEDMPMTKKFVSEFKEDFYEKKSLDRSAWRLPPGIFPAWNNTSGQTELGSTNNGMLEYGLKDNMLAFTGNSVGAVPLRAKQSFSTDVKVEVGLHKTDNCSSHFIVFSTNPNYVFNGWGKQQTKGEDISLLFGFNCNSKYAYGMETQTGYECRGKRVKGNATDAMAGTRASIFGENALEFIVLPDSVVFKDSLCEEDIRLNESIPFGRQFYLFIGADQDVAGKLSQFDRVAVSRASGCDEFTTERHPPLPRTEYSFWDNFETGKCGMKWVEQGAKSGRNLTAPYTYGFDGAGSAEINCVKNNLWFAGSSEGQTSLRIRRPFLGPVTAVAELARTKRCSNHWMAVARSKRFQYGHATMIVDDSFDKGKPKVWWYPPLPKKDTPGITKHWYEPIGEGKLWFEGPSMNTQPMRLREPIVGPFVVKAGLQKTQHCSSQYIVLTTNPYGFLWNWGNSPHAVKFVWNCDEKYVYAPSKNDTAKTSCADIGSYDVEIHATDGKLRFRDNRCKELSVANPFTNTSKVYVLIGADSDTAGLSSSFSYFKVMVPEGASSVGQVVALLGWQCNTKVAMVTGVTDKPVRKSAYCPYRGNIRTEVVVRNGKIVFRTVSALDRHKIVCPDVSIPADFADRGIYYLYAGGNTASRKIRTEYRYFSTMSPPFKLTKDAPHTELYFADQFGSKDAFEKEWKVPDYDHPQQRFGIGLEPSTKEKYAWFSDTQMIPLRTKRSFSAPFTVVTDIIREEKCGNHFIVLSAKKVYHFAKGYKPDVNVVRFFWDCDMKSVAYLDEDGKAVEKRGKCNKMGRFHVSIKVQDGHIVFDDGRCGVMEINSPFSDGQRLYAFIGAAHEGPEEVSRFYSFQIMGRMTFKMPEKAVMKDDFTQYNDWFTRMWTPDASFGSEVDLLCGTAKEKDAPQTSLHFGGGIFEKSERVLTTAKMPFRRGGEVEFWLRYGGDKGMNPMCRYMNDEDGVILEYSEESAYDGFEHMLRLPAHHFGRRLRNEFVKVRTYVDKLHHPEAMTGNTFLRWSQESKKSVSGRGDWAIDRVVVYAKPAAVTKLIWSDAFLFPNFQKWWIPKKSLGNQSAYRLEFSNAEESPGLSIWGSATGMKTMRTKRMFMSNPGLRIDAALLKDHRCSSHFIAISKNKNFEWSWGSDRESVKFAWNCERKYIYAPEATKSTVCNGLVGYETSIEIGDGKVIFADSECTELSLPIGLDRDDPFYIFVGADQDAAGERSRFTNFTIYEKQDDEDMKMKFTLMEDSLRQADHQLWTPPKIHKYTYGYRPHENKNINGSLYFRGSALDQQLLRTSKPFLLPFVVNVEIDRDSQCSGHFVVVSTNKRYRFRKGVSRRGDALTFGYDTKFKYIFGRTQDETVKVKCPSTGLQKVTITVRGSMVVFEDTQCPPLMAPYPIENRRVPLYVMLGANRVNLQGKCSAKGDSLFHQFKVLGRKPVAGLIGSGEGILLSDDFNFRMQPDPKMWDMNMFTGRVDTDCGSVTGGSLHFRNEGERMATTAEVDVQNGADIDFFIRFGGGSAHTGVIHTSCTGLNPARLPSDGIEIQFKDETGNWHSLVKYDASVFHEVFSNFTKLSVRIDKNGPAALASRGSREKGMKGVQFRWIQTGKNRKCCGHWALDNVQIRALPPLPEATEDDDFVGPNPELWWYPTVSESSRYKFGYADTLWFSGDASGQQTVRTTKRYPMGLMMRGQIQKSDKCSSHFIAISPEKDFSWRWGGLEKTIVFAWNCDDKYIYSPHRDVSRQCSRKGIHNFEIEVQDGWVRFSDDKCGDLRLAEIPGSTIGPFYIHIGADQDTKGKKSKFFGFEILKVDEPIQSSLVVEENFAARNKERWVYPELSYRTGGAMYGYDRKRSIADGRLYFSGSFNNQSSVRSVATFSEPLTIKAGIQKTSKCSSHFIVLTTNPHFTWSWGSSEDAVKFAWNCDDKYIYSTELKTRVSTKCNKLGTYNIDIRAYDGVLTFTDGRCDTLETKNPFKPEDPLYIVIGADNDVPVEKSAFLYMRVLKPETRPALGRQMVMWDDFSFKDDIVTKEWEIDATTGRVDGQCKSKFTDASSLHFRNTGRRVATTKTIDVLHGADINFAITFGSTSNIDCFGIIDENDGVEVQYSVNEGETWKTIVSYSAKEYGKTFASGANISLIIDYDHYPKAMTEATKFRWIQFKNDSNACCNQWALGFVKIDAYPYPSIQAVVKDNMILNDSLSLKLDERKDRWAMDEYVWNIFNSTGRPARKFATELKHDLNMQLVRKHSLNKSKTDILVKQVEISMVVAKQNFERGLNDVKVCTQNIQIAEKQIAELDPSNTTARKHVLIKVTHNSQSEEDDDNVTEVEAVKNESISQPKAVRTNKPNNEVRTSFSLLDLYESGSYFADLTKESLNTVQTIMGNPTCDQPVCKQPILETKMSDVLAVRCCSDDGKKIPMIKYGCHKANYSEAKNICQENDLRLCTIPEVQKCLTCYMGCNFDAARIWTSTGDEKLELSNMKRSCRKKKELLPFLEIRSKNASNEFYSISNHSNVVDETLAKSSAALSIINALYEKDAILFNNAGTRMITSQPLDLCKFGATISTKLWGDRTILDALVSTDDGNSWTVFDSHVSLYKHRWERVLFQLAPSELTTPSCHSAMLRIVQRKEHSTAHEVVDMVDNMTKINSSKTGGNRTTSTGGNTTTMSMWALADIKILVDTERIGLEADIMDTVNNQQFCYTFNNMTAPYGHEYEAENLWFYGNNVGRSTVRSKKTFRTEGTIIEAKINHEDKCDNHFIVLSTDPYYKFDISADPEAIKFMFNCGKKAIVAGSSISSSETACFPSKTNITVKLNITSTQVLFSDDGGCEPLVLNMTLERTNNEKAELDSKEATEHAIASATAGNSPGTAVFDCDTIKYMRKKPKSGFYYVNLGGSHPMRVFCDMKQDGGGWMLVAASTGHEANWLLEENATLFKMGRIYPSTDSPAVVQKIRFTAGHPNGKWTNLIDESIGVKRWFKLFTASSEPVSDDGSGDGNIAGACTDEAVPYRSGEGNMCTMNLTAGDEGYTSQVWGGERYKTKLAIFALCGKVNEGAVIMGDSDDENVICKQNLPRKSYPTQYVRVWMKFETRRASSTSFLEESTTIPTRVRTSPGNPKCDRPACKEKVEWTSTSKKLAVRCCLDGNMKLPMSKYGCKVATYTKAQNICAKAGARLCSLSEVRGCKTCGTGCGFDYRRIWTSTTALEKADTPRREPMTLARTLAGNPQYLNQHPEQDTPLSDKLSVRCCSNDVVKVPMHKYGCNAEKTYSEAKEICSSNKLRLCTVEEIKAGRTSGTGCGYDVKRIWTSSSGLKDIGTVKTMIGNPNNRERYKIEDADTPMDKKLAIRCCGKNGDKISMRKYGCKTGTFANAKKVCENAGARLCSAEEVMDCKTCGTGCGFDNKRIWTSTGDPDTPSAEVQKSKPKKSTTKAVENTLEKVKTLAGNPRCKLAMCRKPPLDTAVDALLAVRCCTKEGGRVQMNEYGCNNKKTFKEAHQICETKGFRLCTVKEVEACVTCGTGCGYDFQRIWTMTKSQLPEIIESRDASRSASNEVIKSSQTKVYKTISAMGEENTIKEVSATAKLGVLCCSQGQEMYRQVGTTGPSYGCEKEKTYAEAKSLCRVNGKRLCSLKELVGHSDWSGCRFDKSVQIWSSDGRLPTKPLDEELPDHMKIPPIPIVESFIKKPTHLPSNMLSGDPEENTGINGDNQDLTESYDNVRFYSENDEKVRNFKCSKCDKFHGFYNAKAHHPNACANNGNWGIEFVEPVMEVALSTADYDQFRETRVIAVDEFDRKIGLGSLEQNGFLMFSSPVAAVKKIKLEISEEGKSFCVDNIWWGGKRVNVSAQIDTKPDHVVDGDYYVYIGSRNSSTKAGFSSLKVSGRGSVVNDDDGTGSCQNMWDCEVSEWDAWSNCSLTCDEGIQTRRRRVIREPKNGGMKCPPLTEHRACLKRSCDCVMSEWSPWSECDGTCGGGQRRRNRTVLHDRMTKLEGALYDGKECPALTESKKCEAVAIPCDKTTDKHRLAEIDNSTWCYQSVEEIFPYKYKHLDTDEGGLQFSGNATEQGTLRSKFSFQSLDDFKMEVEVSKVHECANHFIVISTQEYFAWSEEPEPDTFKFAWNCTSKMIISPSRTVSTPSCFSHVDRDKSLSVQKANEMKSAWQSAHTWHPGGGYSKDYEIFFNSSKFIALRNITMNSPISHFQPGSAQAIQYWKESGSSLEDDDDSQAFVELADEADDENDERGSNVNASLENATSSQLPVVVDVSGGFHNVLTIVVGKNEVSFADQHCVVLSLKEGTENKDFFVYLGAAPNDNNISAEFRSIRISGDGSLVNKFNSSGKCPVRRDCVVTPWTPWTNCSAQCLDMFGAGGLQSRSRNITEKSTHGGTSCPVTFQERTCNMRSCDCVLSNFTSWSNCSRECGGGIRTRSRSIVHPPVAEMHGESCPANLTESRSCNIMPCARLGIPSVGISNYTLKDTRFDTFSKLSNDFCYQPADEISPYSYGGFNGSIWFKGFPTGKRTMRSRESFQFPLRVDFVVDRTATSNQFLAFTSEQVLEWNWDAEPDTFKFGWYGMEKRIMTSDESVAASTTCNKLQNNTVRTKGRIILTNSSLTFKDDSGCPPLSVSLADISLGKMTDVFMYLGADQNNAQILDIAPKNESAVERLLRMRRKVMARRGAINGLDLTSKSTFTSIRVSGNGSIIHKFNITYPCPKTTDCEVSPWSNYSTCTEVCGTGHHFRTRNITTKPLWGGASCPALKQTGVCNTQICGRDCKVSEWSEWGQCSHQCNHLKGNSTHGGGHSIRRRKVIVARIQGSHFGLENCPPLAESKRCNTQYCGKDCVMSNWSAWGNCSAECGGGAKRRFRRIISHPDEGSHFGRTQCPPMMEEAQCNAFECKQLPEPPKPIIKSKCAQYSAKPSLSFPYAPAKSSQCSACVADPECGFCPNSGLCLQGNARGPIPRFEGATHILPEDKIKVFMYTANCSAWQFSQCTSEPCKQHKECGGCLNDPYCGWCSATKTCNEGDLAGSNQEFCPRGWLVSPYHADWQKTSGSDGDDMDDNDFFPRSTKQKVAMTALLNQKCMLNERETEAMISKKMSDEIKRVELLKAKAQRCYPCNGTWPSCSCHSQPSQTSLRTTNVIRQKDEATAVDKSLPKDGKISEHWDYGQDKLDAGKTCRYDDQCKSGDCVENICCTKKLRRCGGHGKCTNGIECECEEGFLGKACQKFPSGSKCAKDNDCISNSCHGNICCEASLEKCSGHGQCVKVGKACKCKPKYAGNKCETLALFKEFAHVLE
jgi:hypothetical protein